MPPPDPASLRARRLPDDLAPLAADEVRAKVLRAGFSPADDRPQCAFGQIIRMPRATAERAVEAGVIELVQDQPAVPATKFQTAEGVSKS